MKMTVPELRRRGYPDAIAIGSLSGAGTLGLLIPPSLIMIVYGVQAEVSERSFVDKRPVDQGRENLPDR